MAHKKPVKPAAKTAVETPKAGALSIPNYAMALLYQLLNVPLHGAQSRSRNRFAQIIKLRINYLEDERIKLIEARANKDTKGNPKRFINEATKEEEYDIKPAELEKYRKEFDELMHENTIIDVLPSTKQDLVLVRPLVLESKFPLQTPDGYTYEEICKAFEAI